MYIKLINGKPEKYSIGQLRLDNPNVSFPKSPTDVLLADWDVYPLARADLPSYNDLTQVIVESAPVKIAGVWTQQWTVENKPQEEVEKRARNKRDRLLVKSDWTQVADAPVDKTAWATYRQALRDITDQTGFPTFINWPTEP